MNKHGAIIAVAGVVQLAACAAADGTTLSGGGPSGFDLGSGSPSTPHASAPSHKPAAPSTPPTPKPTWDGTAPKGSVPVTGGTLLVTPDGVMAVAADPDRDLVSIVDLTTQVVIAQLTLPSGAEPGRLVEDAGGRVHVILRRGGGIADIDLFSRSIVGLRQTCALPRGIAYRASDDSLFVSCMTGDLFKMSADPSKREPLAHAIVHASGGTVRDLRDVIVAGDSVYVTTFRAAQLFKVDADGSLVGNPTSLHTRVDPSAAELAAAGLPGGTPQSYVPEVAWRAVQGPLGDLIFVHEGGTNRVINISNTDNGGTQVPASKSCSSSECGGLVCTTTFGPPICAPPILIGLVSSVTQSGIVNDGPALPNGALPVDIAPSPDGKSYAIALAGNPSGSVDQNGKPLSNILSVPAVDPSAGPNGNQERFDGDLCGLQFTPNGTQVPGQVTSVAMDPQGHVVAQTREPAALQYLTPSGVIAVPLSSTSVANPGFDLFHTNTGRGMTCAGCHAEGQDDGRTWLFTDGFDSSGNPVSVQPRRTQTFRDGFVDTAPFHWDGQFDDLSALMQDVFLHRMGARVAPTTAQQAALEAWMNGIPRKMHDAPGDAQAKSIMAGKLLFEDSTVGCATCHSGANFTNNKDADIGFGVALQTPTLVDVAFRAPYLHDGSAATLADRFTDATALGGKHGKTSQLTKVELDDLIAYLETL